MITINDKIKLEIEKELSQNGIKDSKWINGFAFDRHYNQGEISEFCQGKIKVKGINCYYKSGILEGKNVYCQYVPTNPDGTPNLNSLRENHTSENKSGEGK